MDADTRLYLDTNFQQIYSRLETIEGRLNSLHTPAGCGLNERIRALELNEAHRKGMMAIIGTISGVVAGAIMGVLVNLFRRF